MKPTRTVILVADAGRAHMYLAQGRSVVEIEGSAMAETLPPTRDFESDRPGRTSESTGPTRHAYEAPSDPRREAKRGFAGVVAEALTRHAGEQSAERIVIVAPPTMLGDLRHAYSPEVKDLLVREIDKDLTKLPTRELHERLQSIVEGGD